MEAGDDFSRVVQTFQARFLTRLLSSRSSGKELIVYQDRETMSDFPTSYQDPSFEDPSKSTTIIIVRNSADPD
jgi:hypothetical protein